MISLALWLVLHGPVTLPPSQQPASIEERFFPGYQNLPNPSKSSQDKDPEVTA